MNFLNIQIIEKRKASTFMKCCSSACILSIHQGPYEVLPALLLHDVKMITIDDIFPFPVLVAAI